MRKTARKMRKKLRIYKVSFASPANESALRWKQVKLSTILKADREAFETIFEAVAREHLFAPTWVAINAYLGNLKVKDVFVGWTRTTYILEDVANGIQFEFDMPKGIIVKTFKDKVNK